MDEIIVDLPRPRPIALSESNDFAVYVDRIYGHFERMGVLHGIEIPKR
ncbi:hypothetical protein J7E68_03610 [Microbacterium sp. ISL-103]|nr:hypothetical protein [Microbacterium sp. ISL-103]MBT2473685.1 hypothetical protein [Microbacterium sp. ISL-103]